MRDSSGDSSLHIKAKQDRTAQQQQQICFFLFFVRERATPTLQICRDSMAEWLRRQIRNLVGVTARVGSNPTAVVCNKQNKSNRLDGRAGLRRQT